VPLLVIPGTLGGQGGENTGGTTAIPMGYQYNSSLTGEVTQMILDPSFGVAVKGAKENSKLYSQQTQKVSEDKAYNIANAYYQSIVLEKQMKLLKSNLQSTEKTLANTELQFKNGVAKHVDVKRLQVNSSNLKSQIQQAELNLDQALNNLKYQIGLPLTQKIVLSDTALVLDKEGALSLENEQVSFQNRIDFQILQTNLNLLELNKKNNARGYFPTLTAFGNYGYVAQGADFGVYKTSSNGWVDYTTASIGLRLRIPIFDGLQRNARNQQSKLKIRQLEENINLTKEGIDLEVSNASTQYKNTLERIEAEERNVELAKEVYEITQLEFREGVGTSTNVVESETALRQAQNTYITTLLNLYTARLDLEKAKGNLLNYINSK
jgi:outer membrane protein TolC